ncbi:hypothetical protein CDAR_572971 [Caerostris darwini]|uniref:Uncharacterized protein n=1 Tax=Caerostris darwini TaxID=1538125 RepID=A0AAV4W643_9ARAC|nr:hypothetical protein CDAR_572971 [Caerostris darwini]
MFIFKKYSRLYFEQVRALLKCRKLVQSRAYQSLRNIASECGRNSSFDINSCSTVTCKTGKNQEKSNQVVDYGHKTLVTVGQLCLPEFQQFVKNTSKINIH